MDLLQKIGQMFVFGWSGQNDEENTTVSEHARALTDEMAVGGVILLGRNVAYPLSKTAETLNELQLRSKTPLFMVADQEGGMVARFLREMTLFPSNMAIGATDDPGYAYRAARATAEELRAVGVNFNYAPSVDVNNNPDNPIIGTRSYGESPDEVAEFGKAAIRGYQEAGIIACAKHFPGHGDTSVDSHLALPSVPYPRPRLDQIELKPFRAAIEAGVDSIMTTHIMFPTIDPEYPATISKRVITGLLREELGYTGVVTTDCMEMKAIADNFGSGESAVLAVEAGVDLVLACHTLSVQREMYEALLKAVKDGRLSEERIDRSIARIMALKDKYRLGLRRTVDTTRVAAALADPDHKALQMEIARRSVTLVRNREDIVPLDVCDKCKIAVAGTHHSVGTFADSLRKYHANTEIIEVDGDIEEAVRRASEASVVIAVSCPSEPWTKPIDEKLQEKLVNALITSKVPTAVLAVREPYELRKYPEAGTYIASYGYRPPVLDAVAEMLFGQIEASGRLPVTIPENPEA